jgi:hypothetical protein
LFLCAQGLSRARNHDSAYRSRREDRKAREGIRARGVSYRYERTEELVEHLRWYSLGIRARWIQGCRSPRSGSPDHAPRSEDGRAITILPRFALELQWEAKSSFDKFWTFVIERHLQQRSNGLRVGNQ